MFIAYAREKIYNNGMIGMIQSGGCRYGYEKFKKEIESDLYRFDVNRSDRALVHFLFRG